jgi:hypothetical protein
MKERMLFVRSILVALTALALSAGLAFGAAPQASSGLANASLHAGKTVPFGGAEPVTLGEDDETTDEETEETEETVESEDGEEGLESEEAGENCATDPTLATEEELAALKHGSIVCWAAHQAEWPAWFSNHGGWVKCWAHHGKADATSCTVDPAAEEGAGGDESAGGEEDGAVTLRGNGNGKAKGKSKER